MYSLTMIIISIWETALLKVAGDKTNSELVNVFVPTTPNPTSGFLLMFPKSEIIYLDMSFEEAFGKLNKILEEFENGEDRLET